MLILAKKCCNVWITFDCYVYHNSSEILIYFFVTTDNNKMHFTRTNGANDCCLNIITKHRTYIIAFAVVFALSVSIGITLGVDSGQKMWLVRS